MSSVAILMSTYNGERFLDKQIKSLINQKCSHDIEIYIRDDGSEDETHTIVSKWSSYSNIHFMKSKNVGPAMSFWELFSDINIKADFYSFCDQDDIWDEDKLEVAISYLNGKTHLYACNCRIIDADDNIVQIKRRTMKPKISLERLFVSGVTQGCAMVFTDELRNYILKQNITIIPMHDLIVNMYALSFGDFYWDINPHFSYRFHDNNVVANKEKKNFVSKIKKLRKWKKSKNNSLSLVAKELIDNRAYNFENFDFLMDMSKIDHSLRSRYRLLRYKCIKGMDRNALKSFYFRIILRLI